MFNIFFLFIFFFTSARGQGRAEGDSCIDDYTGTIGRCTVRELCQSAEKDLYESRIEPTLCSYNTFGEQIVCCRDGFIFNTPSSGVQDDRPIWSNAKLKDRRRVSERKCEEYSRSVVKKTGYIPLVFEPETYSVVEEKCVYTNVGLIIGGTNAKLGEFPHMAAIGWATFEGGYTFSCGGTLISPRFVMTAAHCNIMVSAATPEPVVVRLGDQNIDDNVNDGADPVDVAIRRIYLHPDYQSPKVYNDIALLELVTDVKLTSAIRPACLWNKADLGGHENVIATGWGEVNTRTGQVAKDLQKVVLPVLEVDYCNRTLQNIFSRNWRHGFIESQMCAGDQSGEKDTCYGDSGAPIQIVSEENSCIFYIVGLTSFGKDCAKIDRPAVYTRVSSFIDWIESIVWPGE